MPKDLPLPPEPGQKIREVLGMPIAQLGLDALTMPSDDELRAQFEKERCAQCGRPTKELSAVGRIVGHTCRPSQQLRLVKEEPVEDLHPPKRAGLYDE